MPVFHRTLRRIATAAAGCLIALLTADVRAELTLAPLFGDHMVIQRNRPIPVWGSGDPGETVEVRLGQAAASATVGTDRTWQVTLDALPAGGPFTLTATAPGDQVERQDVLVGDVWLCSGQSNMQMGTHEAIGGEAAAARVGAASRVRFLTVPKWASDKPSTKLDTAWKVSSPEVALKFSAVGCFFAAELLDDPTLADVPLGLIDSSFGGTAIEAWMPAGALDDVPESERSGSMFGIRPAALYNAMIHPLTPAPVAGVIWYQGEANAGKPQTYTRLLPKLIATWRDAFASPELPFFIVQLPDFVGTMGGHYFIWLRESQAKVAADDPNVHLVVTIGSNDGQDLHPKEKQVIGQRAALLARQFVYGQSIIATPPAPVEIAPDGDAVRVRFDTHGSSLVNAAPNGAIRGFQIAGDDGVYRFADARLDGDTIILTGEGVKNPRTVRYGWTAVGHADLTSAEGVPVAPFRTDTLPVRNVEVLDLPIVRRVGTEVYELTVSGTGKITSLTVGSKQFLNGDRGTGGGTSIPVMFGEKEMRHITQPSPDRITFADDGGVTVALAFDEAAMTWTIQARKDDFDYRINLDPRVEVSKTGGKRVKLERGGSVITIDGIDSIEDRGRDGHVLKVRVAKQSSATLQLAISR